MVIPINLIMSTVVKKKSQFPWQFWTNMDNQIFILQAEVYFLVAVIQWSPSKHIGTHSSLHPIKCIFLVPLEWIFLVPPAVLVDFCKLREQSLWFHGLLEMPFALNQWLIKTYRNAISPIRESNKWNRNKP